MQEPVSICSAARSLIERMSRVAEVKELEMKAELLQERKNELSAARAKVSDKLSTSIVFLRNKCIGPGTAPEATKLREIAADLRNTLQEDPDSIVKKGIFKSLIKGLESLSNVLATHNQNAWKIETSKNPQTNDKFLSLVAQIPGYAAKVATLREARASLLLARGQPPTNQDEWDAYRQLVQKVKELSEGLSPDRFPATALEFCIAAQSSNGAELHLLTGEVRSWLEEHGLIDDLRYSLV